ncbi:AfsR/SARP family transcriptional regulator [Leifsonia sp. Leaf264]|uniref:AfsR/SARP family transcriptional regulator n=1 Tax=Leifsonia sp. Leaf264 TaxID=1736314 RepID=UPI0006F36011|nr:BTAD domain-containing putative transcriptional regulator [Leifsonia sp. Leaf264]KQO96755.1 hypothetical protein ASF30_16800 [Leifsonia sp. Leaf264]
MDPDSNHLAPSRDSEQPAVRAVGRLADRLAAPLVFVTGPAGTGKTAVVRAWAAQASRPVEWLTLTPSHRSPEVLDDALRVAVAAAPTTVVIDDAQLVDGTAAEQAIDRFLGAAAGATSVVVCTRTAADFATTRAGAAEFITGRDLALRLDEIPELFHSIHGSRLGLEQASAVLAETAGWPALVRLLAATVHGYAPGGLDDAVLATIGGDFAETYLARVTSELPPALRAAASGCAPLASLTFDHAAAIAGVEAASALIAAVENGTILTDQRAGADRRLPEALRRHLLRHLPPEQRHELAVTTASLLAGQGDTIGALAALHDSGCCDDVAALLRRESDVLATPGSAPWALALSGRVLRDPLLRAARARALIDDRSVDSAREVLLSIGDDDPDAASARRSLLSEIDSTGTARSVVRPGAEPRRVRDARGLIEAAAQRLRAGAVTEAVPLLVRSLHAPGSSRASTLGARLAISVMRSAVTPPSETSAQVCAIEGEAQIHGLTGLARIARGVLAALSTADGSAEIAAECEDRADDAGAALLGGIAFLTRMRSGRATAAAAGELSARLIAIGEGAASAWAEAAAAVLAADHRLPDARAHVTAAESSGIREALPALRPMIDAARSILEADDELLRDARRAALAAGLPRLPLAIGFGDTRAPAARRGSLRREPAPVVIAARQPRLMVICFGGFRMRVDGADIDLRAVRPQARALLRMLALNAGSPVHRELIAGILWGGLGSSSAVHALHVSISSLRRALSADTGSLPAEILERRGEAYALTLGERRSCDLVEFDKRLARATEANLHHDLDSAAEALNGAVALYTGEVLPEDGPAEWAIGARDRYRLRAAGAASSLAHLELRRHDTRAAVVAAERSVEIDPWLDDSWRTLVAVHRSSGDVVASQRAERAYHRMRVELGVE